MKGYSVGRLTMTEYKFATAINCMDGRVQIPVMEWLKKQYGADYVDMITGPAPERLLAEAKDRMSIETVKNYLKISATRHNSSLVAIVAHHDCAGNPAGKEARLEQIYKAVRAVRSWGIMTQVIGLWVDENWEVTRLKHEPKRI